MSQRSNGHFRDILIGYDGSEAATKALELGFVLAQIMDSRLNAVAVAQPPEPLTEGKLQAIVEGAREQYQKLLQRIVGNAKRNGIEVQTHVVVGHPAEQIISKAEQDHADLIIVGHCGISHFQKLVMGSVSERVSRYAPCPVLVAR